ncbi:Uncharacterised protein [Shewanella baltica]|nr:Uncharacterised protein [Shewanella baltica]
MAHKFSVMAYKLSVLKNDSVLSQTLEGELKR